MLQKRKLEKAILIDYSIKKDSKWVEINETINDDINDLLEANGDSVDFPVSTIHSSKKEE